MTPISARLVLSWFCKPRGRGGEGEVDTHFLCLASSGCISGADALKINLLVSCLTHYFTCCTSQISTYGP